MPYIPQANRTGDYATTDVGRINYEITKLITKYVQKEGLSYNTINRVMGSLQALISLNSTVTHPDSLAGDIVSNVYLPVDYEAYLGVLECIKAEFYRRVAVPYEERKRAENGDVYE